MGGGAGRQEGRRDGEESGGKVKGRGGRERRGQEGRKRS